MDVIKLFLLEGDFLTIEDSIMDNHSLALYNDDIQQDVFSMHPFKALRVDRLLCCILPISIGNGWCFNLHFSEKCF